jgi:hypothetical protein
MTVTKTIGSSGADYATPALWFAFVGGVGTLADDYIGEMHNEEILVTADQTLTGVTPAGHFVRLTAGAGNSFIDNANVLTNALRYNASNGAAIRLASGGTLNLIDVASDQGFQLTRLQICTDTGYQRPFKGYGILSQCIFAEHNTGGVSEQGIAWVIAGSISNCLIYSRGSNATGIITQTNATTSDLTIACTNVSGSPNGVLPSYSSGSIVKNVVAVGFTTAFAGTCSASSSNNATDAGTFSGTNYGGSGQVLVVGATEFVSVTSGSEDFRIKSATAVKLPAHGTASGTPGTDIVGQTRSGSTPTIGAWELVGAPPAAAPPGLGFGSGPMTIPQ